MAANKRRLIPIVDRRFQFKYTAIIMGVAAVISLALGYFLWNANQEMNAMLAQLTGTDLGKSLDTDDAKRVMKLVVGFLVGEVVVLGVLGLFITHRVCGPIFVLNRHLVNIKSGHYPSLRPLRSKDEFAECFQNFSDVVGQLQERDLMEKASLEALQEQAIERGDADAAETLGRMVNERRARLAQN